jgi:hypothetical protein
MDRETVLLFRRGKGGLDELRQAHNSQLRAVTVEGQIKSCPEVAVGAKTRLIKKWEYLTSKNWEKEQERRSKKK